MPIVNAPTAPNSGGFENRVTPSAFSDGGTSRGGEVKREDEFPRLHNAPGGLRWKCLACSRPSGWLARPEGERKAPGYGMVKMRHVSDADWSS
jgi:hypothetical protein